MTPKRREQRQYDLVQQYLPGFILNTILRVIQELGDPYRAQSSILRSRPPILPKTQSPQITFHYHIPSFHGFSVSHTSGRPPIRISRHPAIHKKLQSPQAHISQAIHCSPCPADPHAPRIHIRTISPYVLRGSHILSPSSQNLDIGFDKTSVPGPANPQPTQPHKFPNPAGTAMACASQPAETSGQSTQIRTKPTYSNSLRRRGEHGRQRMSSLRDAATTSTARGPTPVL